MQKPHITVSVWKAISSETGWLSQVILRSPVSYAEAQLWYLQCRATYDSHQRCRARCCSLFVDLAVSAHVILYLRLELFCFHLAASTEFGHTRGY